MIMLQCHCYFRSQVRPTTIVLLLASELDLSDSGAVPPSIGAPNLLHTGAVNVNQYPGARP